MSLKNSSSRSAEIRDIFDAAIECIARIDKQGNYLTVNQSYAEKFNFEISEMLNMVWLDNIDEDDKSLATKAYQDMLDNGRAEIQLNAKKKDGSLINVMLLLVKGIDNQRSPVNHYIFIQRMDSAIKTENSYNEELLYRPRFSLNRFRNLTKIIDMPVISRSVDGTIRECNHSFSRQFGYQTEQIIGKNKLEDIVYDQDRSLIAKSVPDLLEQHGSYSLRYRILNNLEQAEFITEQAIALKDDDNRIIRIDSVFVLDKPYVSQNINLPSPANDYGNTLVFFEELVDMIARKAGVSTVAITECTDYTDTSVRTMAFVHNGQHMENLEYELKNTPCEEVIKGEEYICAEEVKKHFPKDKDLDKLNSESYCAVPLFDHRQNVIGHLYMLDTKPMRDKDFYFGILQDVAAKASIELENYRYESTFALSAKAFSIRYSENFFEQFTAQVHHVLSADITMVIRLQHETQRCETINYLRDGDFQASISFPLQQSPFAELSGTNGLFIADGFQNSYPKFQLDRFHIESFCATELLSMDGETMGYFCVINQKPLKRLQHYQSLIQLFSVRLADCLNQSKHEEVLSAYKNLVSSSSDLMSIVNLDYEYIFVNAAYETYFNKPQDKIVNRHVKLLLGEKDFEEYIKPRLDECINKQARVSGMIVKKFPDGVKKTLHSIYNPYFSPSGNLTSVVVVVRDITDQLSFENELNQARDFLETFIKSSSDIIWLTNYENIIMDVNQRFCEVQRCSREKALGQHASDLDLLMADMNVYVAGELKKPPTSPTELIIKNENGDKRYLLVSVFGINQFGHDRKLFIAKDITEQKQAEILLELENHCYQIEFKGYEYKRTLEQIITLIESYFDGLMGSIMLLDETSQCLIDPVGPGLPDKYLNDIQGIKIGEYVISCGTAAYEDELVIVDDIETSKLWKNFKQFALVYDLKACWSVPIKSGRNKILGTFCGYYKNKTSPTAFEIKIIEKISRIVGNIIAQNENEKRLSESREKFRALYDGTPSMFFSLDEAGRVISVNNFGAKALGYDIHDLIGENVSKVIHEEDARKLQQKIKQYFAHPDEMFRWELRKRHRNGQIIWVNETAHIVSNGNKKELLIVCEDISENFRLAQQLEYQATHDALTNLVNRRDFENRLARLLNDSSISIPGHAICYLDLDNFKIINDTCGHLAGDAMLRQLSELLSSNMRNRDTLARLGGDEFGILIEHCSLTKAKKVAEKILKTVEDFRFLWNDNKFTVGVSIGLVPLNESSGNVTDVLSAADNACYVAKESGRNRIHVFTPDDTELEKRRGEMQWVTRINQALEEKMFCLFYQDIVPVNNHDVSNGRRFELLVRIKTHDGAYILPGAFLPAAERYNLSQHVDQWVLQMTLNWLESDRNMCDKIDSCSINISGQSLSNENFLENYIDIINNSKVPADKLCFEITETAAIANLTNAKLFINELKQKGCRFALDDFGSGLSSFAYLKNLPVDYIKIDGAFIRDLIDDPFDYEMVSAINRLGQTMKLQTIAEFVENDEIFSMLRKLGVNFAQGYGIQKPEPIERFKH